MAAPKKHISLLPRGGFEATTLGRVLTWSLNTGRVIVIIVELVVITAFLSRFWFDRILTDLNQQIEERVALIKASQIFEQQFKKTQIKLARLNALTQQATGTGEIIEKIMAVVPPEIALLQLTTNPQQIQVNGTALSEQGLELFIQNLEQLKFGEVALSRVTIDTREEIGIGFTVRILKEKVQEK